MAGRMKEEWRLPYWWTRLPFPLLLLRQTGIWEQQQRQETVKLLEDNQFLSLLLAVEWYGA